MPGPVPSCPGGRFPVKKAALSLSIITAFDKRERFGIRCALWRASTGLATVGRVSKGNLTVKCSWKLARISGIDIYLHWFFLIVPAWVALTWLATGSVLVSAVSASLFILAVFVCVLLRQFGHAARSEAAETLRASREASAVRPEPVQFGPDAARTRPRRRSCRRVVLAAELLSRPAKRQGRGGTIEVQALASTGQ